VALDEEAVITDFAEKADDPPSNEAIIGLYYVKDAPHLIRAIEEQIADEELTKGEYFIADALQRMINDGAEFTTATVDFWLDCGKPHTLLATNRFLLDNGASNTVDGNYTNVTIIPPVYIHPDADLKNAVIGPNATISRGCTIHDAIVRDSIVDAGATVSGAMLTESLIGRDAHVKGTFQKLNVGDKSSMEFG
jgi:glucose-1-phosphate thymidylyltransferase